MSNSDINGKTALVTGASKGIGKAICLELAQMGVKVAVNYNSSKSEAEQVVQTITDMGGEAFKIHADVSDLETGQCDGGQSQR